MCWGLVCVCVSWGVSASGLVGREVCVCSVCKKEADPKRTTGRGASCGRRMTRRAAARNSWRSPRPGATAFVAPPPPPPPNNLDVAKYAAFVKRANETLRTKPFCALADLQRVLIAGEALSGLDAAESARATMDMLIPQLRSVFERFLPDEAKKQPERAIAAGPTPKANEWTPAEKGTGVGRMCIYKIEAGSLLFRGGPPTGSAARPHAAYHCDCGDGDEEDDEALLHAADARRQQQLNRSNGIVAAPSPSPPSDLGPRLRPIPTVDARASSGVAAACAAARAPHAVLIRHANLLPELESWTGETLATELDGVACHVLAAPASSNRFTYFWGSGSDTMHAHYDAPPTVTSIGMSFHDFRQKVRSRGGSDTTSLYLQTGLVQRNPEGELRELVANGQHLKGLLKRLTQAANIHEESGQEPLKDNNAAVSLIQSMVREGNMGRYTRTALFASVPGAVTRLHYDHYDNIYLQLKGRKRFVLLEPLQARGLYPFPLHHPLDQRARVHLDALKQIDPTTLKKAYPQLGITRGFEVDLGPGDILFIPHHWWHHVETTEGDDNLDGLSLSLNLWFDFQPRIVSPSLPLYPGLLLELARHCESWLSMIMEPKSIPSFLESCALEVKAAVGTADEKELEAADLANAKTLDRGWLVCRCLLFAELACASVGWDGLRPFVEDLLCVERFRGLVRVEREMGG